jgi:DNA-binding transcriptional MerR regulator
MRIGEVAENLAVNPRTIRYYESIGLIPEPRRTQSGYRDYEADDFRRLRFIKTARRLDFTIDEIREILAFTDASQVPCGHVRDVVSRKADELDDRITEMLQLRDELREIERSVPISIETGGTLCPLLEHRGKRPRSPDTGA